MSEEKKKEITEHNRYCKQFEQYSAKDKSIIYVLWAIHTKKKMVGSMLFFEELENKFGLNKTQWNLVKEFLSGANVMVNQVIIQATINKELVNRFGLLDE